MKTTSIIITAAILSLAVQVAAQDENSSKQVTGSGVLKSEKRDVENFDAVTLKGSVDVAVTIGDKTEVIVKADENILPYITTEVQNKELAISTKSNISLNSKDVKVLITTPNLLKLAVQGSGKITADGLKGDSFKTVIDGSGKIAVKGQVQKSECLISGSGKIASGDLNAKEVDVKIAGSGKAMVNAIESLQAKIAGSGDIVYKKNAKLKIVKNIIGSGKIHAIESLDD